MAIPISKICHVSRKEPTKKTFIAGSKMQQIAPRVVQSPCTFLEDLSLKDSAIAFPMDYINNVGANKLLTVYSYKNELPYFPKFEDMLSSPSPSPKFNDMSSSPSPMGSLHLLSPSSTPNPPCMLPPVCSNYPDMSLAPMSDLFVTPSTVLLPLLADINALLDGIRISDSLPSGIRVPGSPFDDLRVTGSWVLV